MYCAPKKKKKIYQFFIDPNSLSIQKYRNTCICRKYGWTDVEWVAEWVYSVKTECTQNINTSVHNLCFRTRGHPTIFTNLTQIVNNYLCCFPFSPIMHAFKLIQPSPGNFSYFLHHSNYLFCACTVQPLNGMTIQSVVKLVCMYGFKCSSDFVKEYSICPVMRKKSKKNHLLPIHNVFSSTMNYSL